MRPRRTNAPDGEAAVLLAEGEEELAVAAEAHAAHPPGVRERGDGVHALHQARVLSNVTRPSAYPAAKRSQHCCGPLWRAPRCPPSPSAASPADLDHAPCTGHPRRHVHVAHLTFLSWEGSSNAVPSPAPKYMCSCPPSAPPLRRHSDVRARCQEDNRASLDLQAALPFTLGGYTRKACSAPPHATRA